MIAGMLSWYDEDPSRLQQCVSDMHAIGAEAIIAVDGAYSLFPYISAVSSRLQREVISDTAHALRMALIILEPANAWSGNEVEKRQTMLDLALSITDDDDWLLVWDADYKLDSYPRVGIPGGCEHDFIDVRFTDAPEGDVGWHWARLMMRAKRGLKMGPNHYTYVMPTDGGGTYASPILPREPSDLERAGELGIYIRHLVHRRDDDRRQKQTRYYEARDSQGIER